MTAESYEAFCKRVLAYAEEEWDQHAFLGPRDLAKALEEFAIKEIKAAIEACAKIADGHKIKISDASPSYWDWGDCGHNEAAVEIADEIRKRDQS